MSQFDVSVDLSDLLVLSPMARGHMLSHLNAAVAAVAQRGAERWKAAVLSSRLWKGESEPYAASIRWEMTGDYSAQIVSDYKFVQDIEDGRPAYDLKRMLDTSSKVRITKAGKRFLVIPFRDGVPGSANAMPSAVHALARNLAPSTVSKVTQRPAGERTFLSPHSGMRRLRRQLPFASDPKTKGPLMVAKRLYDWGDRLTQRQLRAAGVGASDAKKYAGMYRFNIGSEKAPRSGYMRFRIMMEGSAGWIIPPRPGLHIAQGVVSELRSMAQQEFNQALHQDLI